jgi:hypothetical protein
MTEGRALSSNSNVCADTGTERREVICIRIEGELENIEELEKVHWVRKKQIQIQSYKAGTILRGMSISSIEFIGCTCFQCKFGSKSTLATTLTTQPCLPALQSSANFSCSFLFEELRPLVLYSTPLATRQLRFQLLNSSSSFRYDSILFVNTCIAGAKVFEIQ